MIQFIEYDTYVLWEYVKENSKAKPGLDCPNNVFYASINKNFP